MRGGDNCEPLVRGVLEVCDLLSCEILPEFEALVLAVRDGDLRERLFRLKDRVYGIAGRLNLALKRWEP